MTKKAEHPFWETDKKCNYGYFADLTKLPVGTIFRVSNGAWKGKIIEKDGQKCLTCLDIGKTYYIKGNEDLVIEDVMLPQEKIELVIKILDKDYQNLKAKDKFDNMYLNYYEKLIVNGTPLPKGHGDLKDMDDIYEALEGWNEDTGWIVDAIDFQTETLIKADEREVNNDD